LTSEAQELDKAIALEATLLEPLAIDADLRLDTSHIGVYELGRMLKARVCQTEQQHLSLMIQSFGFKHDQPTDSDFLLTCVAYPILIGNRTYAP